MVKGVFYIYNFKDLLTYAIGTLIKKTSHFFITISQYTLSDRELNGIHVC